MSALIGVLMLGVVSVIIYQIVRSGSQGPAALSQVRQTVTGFYGTLMGK